MDERFAVFNWLGIVVMSVLCQSSACPNGNPPSKLECPSCNKLGIQGSFFCGQPCFKAGWVRKDFLRLNVDSDYQYGTYNPFPDFSYTGTVRPVYPLSARRTLPTHIQRPDYAETGTPHSEIKARGQPPRILSAEEQAKMRKVCRLGREVLDLAASHIRPGITTDEIDEIVHNACIERNAYPSPLNYNNFPKSVCTSVNEVICHGIPDKYRLKEGDIINIGKSLSPSHRVRMKLTTNAQTYHCTMMVWTSCDPFSTLIDLSTGFHSDLNETYPVGKIDDESRKLLRVARECLDDAISICKPGALFRDVGKVIEPKARAAGCSTVRDYTGHGTNDLFHGPPNHIPHYAKNKATGTMKPGMCFTIEPMINLGSKWETLHWPDNWTATTVDGKRSAQFEETLLITETGVEILTAGAKREF
ncbi:hypothetical protein ONZ45_g13042 [Pleurotus djamor]|nr:hypothetical protein ONZ45_g13042 [Pleurotus djamor]